MNVFQQACADVEFVRSPLRLGGFFPQPKVGDGLLCGVGLAFLLIVVKKSDGGVEIFRAGEDGGVSIVAKLAETLRIAQKIEITLHQLRIPERLAILLLHGPTLADSTPAVLPTAT